MKEISLNWRNKEANNIMELKMPDWKLIRDKNQNYPRYCSICSADATSVAEPKPRVIYHIHNSSLQYRITAPNDTWGNYPCITYKATPHSCKTGLKYPLLMTSLILIDGCREKDMRRNILEMISTWNVLESLELL